MNKRMICTFLLTEGQNIFPTNLFCPVRQILLSSLILKMKKLRLGELEKHD